MLGKPKGEKQPGGQVFACTETKYRQYRIGHRCYIAETYREASARDRSTVARIKTNICLVALERLKSVNRTLLRSCSFVLV